MTWYRTLGPITYTNGDSVENITKAGVRVDLSPDQAAEVAGMVVLDRTGPFTYPKADILKYDARVLFPTEGDDRCVYLASDSGLFYRWINNDYAITSISTDWDDISDKPVFIAAGDNAADVLDDLGGYAKPGTGIPKTDLASAVQTSLGKADTAYQAPAVVGAGVDQTAARAAIGAGTASTKSDVGLGSTDNTADTAKPVSTPQRAALGGAGDILNRATPRATPELYVSFAGQASVPTVFDSGQAASSLVDTTVNGQFVLTNGALTFAPNNAGIAASYFRGQLAATATRIGMRFRFAAQSTTNGVVAMAICRTQIVAGVAPTMSLHFVIARGYLEVGVWNGVDEPGTDGLTALATVPFTAPLSVLVLDDATEYEAEAWISGTTCTYVLRTSTGVDIVRGSVTDSRIGSYGGPHVFFETFTTVSTTDNIGRITHAWASSGTSAAKPAVDTVTLAGVQTLAGKTLTTPIINILNGVNGKVVATFTDSASAVNYLALQSVAATGTPIFSSQGTDTNISIMLVPKGTGTVHVYAPTGQTPAITADGADTNHDLNLVPKGTGLVKASGQEVATVLTVQTFQNKRIKPRVNGNTTATTLTPSADNDDVSALTALASALTIAAPTGTPTGSGQLLTIRLKDNGTPQTLTFNAAYRFSSDLAAPTVTVANKTLYMWFIWNGTDSKWDCYRILGNF